MKGLRKVIIGISFIISSTFLVYVGLKEKAELIGLCSVLMAYSGGVFGIIYGNIQENKFNSKSSSDTIQTIQ